MKLFAGALLALDGWLAWSARGADGRFRLTLRDPRGVVTTPEVASRGTSFDVDLGPGPDGVVAAYSRCRREVRTSGSFVPADYDDGDGCDVYLLDVAIGTERRLAGVSTATADETWPTVWRDRVAFVRSYDRAPARPYLYVRPLAGGASTRLPGGPRGDCRSFGGGRTCAVQRVSRPYALDLAERILAFGWTFAGGGEGLDTQIRLDTIGGGHRVVAQRRSGGMTGHALGWPAVDAGRVHFSAACFGDPGGCAARPELLRHQIASGLTSGAGADRSILGHARDGTMTWLLLDSAVGTDCQGDPAVPGGTCVLRGVRPTFR